MTIAIAANFSEGVILGADSALTFMNADEMITHVMKGAQKIYHIGARDDCSDSPYGALVYGAAEYEGQPWRNVIGNFWRKIGVETLASMPTAESVVSTFRDFLLDLQPDKCRRTARGEAGLFIAGFGKEDSHVRAFRLRIGEMEVVEIALRSVEYDGIPKFVQHLLFGMNSSTDESLRKRLGGALIEVRQPDGSTKQVELVEIIEDIISSEAPVCTPEDCGMPLRDALDYIHFLVYSTIKYFKFARGAPLCGGEVELAAITVDRGFRRIMRKPLDFCLP